jgi:hypothetical protein
VLDRRRDDRCGSASICSSNPYKTRTASTTDRGHNPERPRRGSEGKGSGRPETDWRQPPPSTHQPRCSPPRDRIRGGAGGMPGLRRPGASRQPTPRHPFSQTRATPSVPPSREKPQDRNSGRLCCMRGSFDAAFDPLRSSTTDSPDSSCLSAPPCALNAPNPLALCRRTGGRAGPNSPSAKVDTTAFTHAWGQSSPP